MNKKVKIILTLSLIVNFIFIISCGIYAYKKSIALAMSNKNKNVIVNSNINKYPINYYIQKSAYDSLPKTQNDIIFYGDSLTNFGQWSEIFQNADIKNRGISGDNTERLLDRIDEITKIQPSKVFLMGGINDLIEGKTKESIISNEIKIIDSITKNSPNTKLFVESVLPINNEKYKLNYPSVNIINEQDIIQVNNELKKICKEHRATYIDLYSLFTSDGLNNKYTVDGVHLTGEGYEIWGNAIKKYID